jgi:hypothetical protein
MAYLPWDVVLFQWHREVAVLCSADVKAPPLSTASVHFYDRGAQGEALRQNYLCIIPT